MIAPNIPVTITAVLDKYQTMKNALCGSLHLLFPFIRVQRLVIKPISPIPGSLTVKLLVVPPQCILVPAAITPYRTPAGPEAPSFPVIPHPWQHRSYFPITRVDAFPIDVPHDKTERRGKKHIRTPWESKPVSEHAARKLLPSRKVCFLFFLPLLFWCPEKSWMKKKAAPITPCW